MNQEIFKTARNEGKTIILIERDKYDTAFFNSILL